MLSNYCQSWLMTTNTQQASLMESFLLVAMNCRKEWVRPLLTQDLRKNFKDFNKRVQMESLQITISISQSFLSILTIQHRQESKYSKAQVATAA